MAKKDKLTKSKSIYSIKKKHSSSKNGIIYENDHFTIIPNDGIFDEDEGQILFSESIFKYSVNSTPTTKKRHVRSPYITREPNGDEDTNIDEWTLENISGCTTISNESKIVLKPNYSSLKDFAYFGSAVELIKATIRDIIMRFPGGISYYPNADAPTVKDLNTNKQYYLVSNEFEIDCWTSGGAIVLEKNKNPMRILSASYMNYVYGADNTECSAPIFTYNKSTCPNTIIGTVDFAGKKFSIFMNAEGEKFLVTDRNGTGNIIRPKQSFIDKFWDEMDDFERVLLNRDSTPVYKSVFETPFFNETGFYYENKSYIWPTVGNDGFTPDVTTGAFQSYLDSLLSLAEFHDTYDSDNIWRMMTHESIKNLDWTHTNKNGVEQDDFDATGIGAMLRIYGRQFDDIKRYADNIKTVNSLSYDEKNNIPDYFLSDKIELNGWEAQHTSPFELEETDEIILSGKTNTSVLYTSGKTIDVINSAFQRRLSLSSKYIQSMKGTRRGIEAILGMFGYTYDTKGTKKVGTFTIDEHVTLVEGGLDYNETVRLRCYHTTLYESDTAPHGMYGYPVALVKPNDKNITEYLIPWFDKKTKYDIPFYFQGKGGWGKRAYKYINLPSLTNINILSGTSIPIYSETQPYMKFVSTIDEMLSISNDNLYKNIICYVVDISNIENEYVFGPDIDGNTTPEFSHYFSLKNIALSTRCGFVSNDIYNCYGWKNITPDEIKDCTSTDGQRVIYLESLMSNLKGNNPHIGYGHYDDGESYYERFTNIFGELFKTGVFDFLELEEPEDYNTLASGQYGFKLNTDIVDNKKCAYYKDYNDTNLLKNFNEVDVISGWNSSNYKEIKFPDTPTIDDDMADESQANGVMNSKKLIINFNVNNNDSFKKYIESVVLKYLEQMIPSTAILEYRFDGESVGATINEVNIDNGTFTYIRTAHASVDKNDDTITVWREYPTPISEM